MRLASIGVPLTMCPLSNLELQVTPDLTRHPLKRLLDAGVHVTVNSDDPAYFDGYLAANYEAVQQALALDYDDIAALARNSITASWLPPERICDLLGEIDEFVAGVRRAEGPRARRLRQPVAARRTAAAAPAQRARRDRAQPSGGQRLRKRADAPERIVRPCAKAATSKSSAASLRRLRSPSATSS